MTYYIIATRKIGIRKNVQEITHYKYNNTGSQWGNISSKVDFYNMVSPISDLFWSYNIDKNKSVQCKWRQIGNGTPFLESIADTTIIDNLLDLPDC